MSPSPCAACNAPFDDAFSVCRFCGSSRRPARSVEDQRKTLHEYRQAMAHALGEIAPTNLEEHARIRNRFLQNALLPSSDELLLEEALYCRQLFTESDYLSEVPKARFDTCLTRLQLLAIEDPRLTKQVELLRQQLAAQEIRERASNRQGFVAFGLVVAFLLAGIVGAVMALRSC